MNTIPATTPDPNVELVPLAILSVELDVPIDQLARRLAGDVTLDDLGLRVVTSATVARIMGERRAELAEAVRRGRAQQAAAAAAKANTRRVLVPDPRLVGIADRGFKDAS